MSKVSNHVPIVVIGGGAAGLIAAITAARTGARVLLLEKNAVVGKKLSVTGGGRCNITNATPLVRDLLSHYQEAGKFLFSPFAKFGVTETRAWFEAIGVPTVEQAERRVFPVHESAPKVTSALLATARDAGVTIRTKVPVSSMRFVDDRYELTLPGERLFASVVILATGGVSHPETGSTGDALPWLAALGHKIVVPESSLVPVAVAEHHETSRVSGIALTEARVTVRSGEEILSDKTGKILFTHFGLSGPAILNASRMVVEALAHGQATICLDLLPEMPIDMLETWLIEKTMINRNKLVVNAVRELLPTALVKVVMERAGIDVALPGQALTVALRRRLISTLKAYQLTPTHVLGPEHAIVTSGGVELPEIDFRTMESKRCKNLFIVGDVLNINRPSGGFSLQLCWTTGYVAGLEAGTRVLEANKK